MKAYDPDRLVKHYIKQLNARLRGLPRTQRREVVSEVAAHIADGRAELRDESEAELRNLLDRLGEPSDIAAEARERFGATGGSNGHEIAAIILLLVGGFLFLIGWFVGVVLLWTSKIWTTRDKLIGTLILPFGLAFSAGVFFAVADSGETCGTSPQPNASITPTCNDQGSTLGTIIGVAVGILVLIAPILTTIYLSWRLRQDRAQSDRPYTPRLGVGAVAGVMLVCCLALIVIVWLASQTLVPMDSSGAGGHELPTAFRDNQLQSAGPLTP